MKSGGAATLVCFGEPGSICFPAVVTPFPNSALEGSVACCGPNWLTGNDVDAASFATHPIVGTVSALIIPRLALPARNASDAFGVSFTVTLRQK